MIYTCASALPGITRHRIISTNRGKPSQQSNSVFCTRRPAPRPACVCPGLLIRCLLRQLCMPARVTLSHHYPPSCLSEMSPAPRLSGTTCTVLASSKSEPGLAMPGVSSHRSGGPAPHTRQAPARPALHGGACDGGRGSPSELVRLPARLLAQPTQQQVAHPIRH